MEVNGSSKQAVTTSFYIHILLLCSCFLFREGEKKRDIPGSAFWSCRFRVLFLRWLCAHRNSVLCVCYLCVSAENGCRRGGGRKVEGGEGEVASFASKRNRNKHVVFLASTPSPLGRFSAPVRNKGHTSQNVMTEHVAKILGEKSLDDAS